MIDDIEQFLGYDNTTDAVLIGAGRLGQALMGYRGFEEYGLNVLAAFDTNPTCDHTEDGKPILHMDQLEQFCRAHKVLMGIITVPDCHAQAVCDKLIECGITPFVDLYHCNLELCTHPSGGALQHPCSERKYGNLSGGAFHAPAGTYQG